MRTIAISVTHKNSDILNQIVRWVKSLSETRIVVYSKDDLDRIDGVENRRLPDDTLVSEAKVKNFITNDVIEGGTGGFIHIIDNTVEIFSDPSMFIFEIERMMTKFHIGTWLNTVTDPMNYTFKIYNPRFSIRIDEEELKRVYDKTVYFTSHANTSWVIWNTGEASRDELLFDDRFTIPMYFIVKFLADRRKRHEKGKLSYMNLYPTVSEEQDVFRLVNLDSVIPEPSQKDNMVELNMFRGLNVDVNPTLDINIVMEDIISAISMENS